jgi:archaemetzincin
MTSLRKGEEIAFIAIRAVGSVESRLLNHLAGQVSSRLGVPCRVCDPVEEPNYAFKESRGQYDSKQILNRLIEGGPPGALRVLGITQVDLFVPILKYVFGLAEVDGQCALISTHRLRPEFYKQPANFDLLLQRTIKTAIHELGHTLGITHCRDWRCVMFSSSQIDATDTKNSAPCRTCLELFLWHFRRSIPSLVSSVPNLST